MIFLLFLKGHANFFNCPAFAIIFLLQKKKKEVFCLISRSEDCYVLKPVQCVLSCEVGMLLDSLPN